MNVLSVYTAMIIGMMSITAQASYAHSDGGRAAAGALPKNGDTLFLYVAPSPGKGPADGSMAHPFASPEQARLAIRRLREKNTGHQRAVTVRLRKGIYELKAGLVLTADDSGTEEAPILYTAFPGEKVILSGAREVPAANVTMVSKEAAQRILNPAAVPMIREIDLRALGITDYGRHQVTGFRRPYVNAAMELFINGQPYHLARYPNDKKIAFDTADVVDNGFANPAAAGSSAGNPAVTGKKEAHAGRLRCDKAKLRQWAQASDVFVGGNFSFAWATDQSRIAAIDTAKGIITLADAHPFPISGGKEWNQYYFFNLLEEIDQPGEYYIDPEKGRLYFYPLQPLLATDTIQLSMLEEALVSLKGASHIQFRDLVFEAGRGIGVYMENTRSNQVVNCTLRNMGVVGVCIGKGSQPEPKHLLPDPLHPVCPNESLSEHLGSLHELLYENTVFNREGGSNNGVLHCRIENTGCGGVSLGGGDRRTLAPAGNYVYNCEFTNCGRIDYSYKAPVNIDGVGNKIQHCLFHASPATAIYLHGNDHLIEYNVIREACDFIDDQGAFYMGRDPSEAGNIIRWNFFENIGHLGMTMAVYFDDGACGSDVYGNVFYKAGTRTILVGGGSYNHIFNNVFIGSELAFHLDDRLSNWARNSLDSGGLFALRLRQAGYDRVPFKTSYPWLAGYFSHHPELPQHNDIENNVLVNVTELHNGEAVWGPIHDNNLIMGGDPGFVNAGALDFSLLKESAVFKKLPDFKAIPFSEMGLLKK